LVRVARSQRWDCFELIETMDDDEELSFREFPDACTLVGIQIDKLDVDTEFDNMDIDGSGAVSYAEFYAWCAQCSVPVTQAMVIEDRKEHWHEIQREVKPAIDDKLVLLQAARFH
jgi:Ca2+-binding EF-hand superfamily protein